MNTKHTPGPWGFSTLANENEPLDISIHANGFGISTVDIAHINLKAFDWPTQEANARLIAAAPELLAACKQAASTFASMATGDAPHLIPEARMLLAAAIAKATGGGQ